MPTVKLHSQEIVSDVGRFPLAPGMQVAAEIHLGTRSVLEYVLSPGAEGLTLRREPLYNPRPSWSHRYAWRLAQ
jgi:hypothetical protein